MSQDVRLDWTAPVAGTTNIDNYRGFRLEQAGGSTPDCNDVQPPPVGTGSDLGSISKAVVTHTLTAEPPTSTGYWYALMSENAGGLSPCALAPHVATIT